MDSEVNARSTEDPSTNDRGWGDIDVASSDDSRAKDPGTNDTASRNGLSARGDRRPIRVKPRLWMFVPEIPVNVHGLELVGVRTQVL